MYTGQIKKHNKKKKAKINWKSLIIWYIGIILSFLPILVDMCVYLSKHDSFELEYWINVCLKGDLLWIFATILILTIIDYAANGNKTSGFKNVCMISGVILWGLTFGLWLLFKYVYPEDYNGLFPIIMTAIFGGVALIVCSPLQIKKVEVK